ncbi:MAG: hypothetical protein KF708_20605 [Pirellulales bacterium]|nr:hypothetical protein [Pirellulales bacterium]
MIRPSGTPCAAFRACLLAVLVACHGPRAGAQPPSETPSTKFRRVYVPADRVSEWPVLKVPYKTVPPAEFESWIRQIDEAVNDPHGAPLAAHVSAAHYTAEWDGAQRLSGEARLTLSHLAAAPALLPLEPCNVAIARPHWAEVDEASESDLPALGLDSSRRLAVLVDRAGTLVFDWQLVHRGAATGAVTFDLQLPRGVESTLDLRLPTGWRVEASQGIVTPPDTTNATASQVWRLEFGAHTSTILSFMAIDAVTPEDRAIVRQTSTYDLSLSGVEVAVQLEFDVRDKPLRDLVVRVPNALRLVSARLGEERLSWTSNELSGTQETALTLHFEEPVLGTKRIVRLQAVAPAVVDELWRLPVCRPQGVFWQEGTATLRVDESLVAESLQTTGARQTSVGPLAEPLLGHAIGLQFFAVDGQVELLLRPTRSVTDCDNVALYESSGTEILVRLATQLRVSNGDRFTVMAELHPGWNVESLEVAPAGTLAEWRVEPSEGDVSRLLLRLTEPVTVEHPVTVRLTAHRLRADLEETIRLEDLRVARYERVDVRHEWLGLATSSAQRLEFEATHAPTPLDTSLRTMLDATLFEGAPDAVYYDWRTAPDEAAVRFVNQRPAYTGTVRVDVAVHANELAETTTVECVPTGNRVDRMLVQFIPPRDEPIIWQQGDDDGSWFTARRLEERPLRAAGFLSSDEVWEIHLRQPRSVAFTLEAVRSVPRTDLQTLSLATLPEATSQSATVSISSTPDAAVVVDNHRLQPIPPLATTASLLPLATFRYSTSDIVNTEIDPVLVVHRAAASPPEAAAVAWSSHLDSQYDAQGAAQHLLSLRLTRQGLDRLALEMPRGSMVREVRLDGHSLPRHVEDRTLTIPLAPSGANALVEVRYSTQHSSWSSVDSLEDPTPRLPAGLERLNHTWRVALPHDVQLLSPPSHSTLEEEGPDDWGQRWFGLFAWGPRGETFLPWNRDDWYTLVAGDARATAAERAVTKTLTVLGSDAPTTNSKPQTWGALVEGAATALRPAWHVLVDEHALLEVGVTPQSVPATPATIRPLDRGEDRLAAAGLLLVAHEQTLLLTTSRRGAEHARELDPPPSGDARWRLARRGDFAEWIEGPPTRFVSATHWSQQAPLESTLSHTAAMIPPGPIDGTVYLLDAGHLGAASYALVRIDRLRIFAWLLFAAVLAWGWPRRQSARGLWIVITLAAAAAALVVPAAVSMLFSAILVAALALLVAGLLRPPTLERPVERHSFGSRTLRSTVSRASLVLLTVAAAASIGRAAPPRIAKANAPFEVLIPVDAERRPTGARYQVPEELYNRLQEVLTRSKSGPQGTLIEAAVYRTELTAVADKPTLSVGQIAASFDLRVFGSPRRVVIPLERERSGIVPNSARLDGLECATQWNADGSQLEFDVPGPGRYRFELTLQPATTATAGMRGMSLVIPPVPASRFEVDLPSAVPMLAVPTALGFVQVNDENGKLRAELGPTDRLELSWRDAGTGTRSGSPGEVEQLLWLQVRPGAVVIEARLNYGEVPADVSLLEWEIDPRLRLIPAETTDEKSPRVRTASNAPQRLQFELSPQHAGPLTLAAKFLYTESSGVGSLALPRIAPVGASVAKSWLAVSADAALETQVLHGDDVTAFDAEKFLAAWTVPPAQPPWRVFALPGTPHEWRVVTRPKATEKTVADRLDFSVDRQKLFVEYQAEITAAAGACFQHVVEVPASIEVDAVSLDEGTESRLLRWSREEEGRLTIQLTRAAEGVQTLRLHGSLDNASPADLVLPRIKVAEARRTAAQLRVFRRPGVLIEVEASGAIANLPAPETARQDPARGHFVRAFRAEREEDWSGDVLLRTRDNAPQVSLAQATVLRREKEAWLADLELELDATDGLVDELQFRVPPAWSGPFTVEPALATAAVTSLGADQILTLRFHPPVSAQARLTVRSPLAAQGTQGTVAPNIEPLHLSDVERYVTLPKLVDFVTVSWETRGLIEAPRPEELSTSAFPQSERITYRVQGQQFEARLSTHENAAALPRVHLADFAVTLDGADDILGVATFLVEPAGLTHCPLVVPAGQRLLAVSVDGSPALLEGVAEERYQVTLHHDRLPQVIEVLFLDEPRAGAVAAPALGELPVAHTIWTLASDVPIQLRNSGASAIEYDVARSELARLTAAAELLELGIAQSADIAPIDLQNWLRPWRERIERMRTELRQAREDAPSDIAGHLDAELARIAEILGHASLGATTTASDARRDVATVLLSPLALHDPSYRQAWSFQGAQPRVEWRHLAPRVAARRYVTPAVLAVAALLLASLVGGRVLSDWTWRWPHFIGVAIGLIWWLWLWPSLLGLLLAVASALLATRVVRRPLVLGDRSTPRFRTTS